MTNPVGPSSEYTNVSKVLKTSDGLGEKQQ